MITKGKRKYHIERKAIGGSGQRLFAKGNSGLVTSLRYQQLSKLYLKDKLLPNANLKSWLIVGLRAMALRSRPRRL